MAVAAWTSPQCPPPSCCRACRAPTLQPSRHTSGDVLSHLGADAIVSIRCRGQGCRDTLPCTGRTHPGNNPDRGVKSTEVEGPCSVNQNLSRSLIQIRQPRPREMNALLCRARHVQGRGPGPTLAPRHPGHRALSPGPPGSTSPDNEPALLQPGHGRAGQQRAPQGLSASGNHVPWGENNSRGQAPKPA